MFRFFQNTKRSLDSLLNLITDLVADGLLFFRLLLRSRTSLSVKVLFLLNQLAFYEERQVQPRRLNDFARFALILSVADGCLVPHGREKTPRYWPGHRFDLKVAVRLTCGGCGLVVPARPACLGCNV